MVFSWLDTKEVDALADEIVGELRQRFPPAGAELSTQKAVERAMRSVDRLMLRVSAFARNRPLNIYKKARFGNRIKWALRDAGYPAPFIEVMTGNLTTQLTLASRLPRDS